MVSGLRTPSTRGRETYPGTSQLPTLVGHCVGRGSTCSHRCLIQFVRAGSVAPLEHKLSVVHQGHTDSADLCFHELSSLLVLRQSWRGTLRWAPGSSGRSKLVSGMGCLAIWYNRMPRLCYFPVYAVTNYHKLGDLLKATQIYSLKHWKAGV